MLSVGERLANSGPTKTSLRRSARVNFHKQPTSVLSFVSQHEKEGRPSGVSNRLSEHPASKPFNIQVLNGYQPVCVNDLSRFFVMKVSALIADVIVEPLKQEHRLVATVRAPLAPRYTPLQAPELDLGDPEPARVLNRAPVAQCGEVTKPHINPDGVRIERQGFRFTLDTKQREPAASLTFDCQGFNPAFNRPMLHDFNNPDFRQSKFAPKQCVPNAPKHKTVESSHGSEARIPRILPTLNTSEERLKGKMDILQDMLQNLRVDSLNVLSNCSDVRQLSGLGIKPYGLSLQTPSVPALLKRGVIKLAAHCQLLIQDSLLGFGGIDTVSKRLYH